MRPFLLCSWLLAIFGALAYPAPMTAQTGEVAAPPAAEVFSRRDLIEPLITSLGSSPQSFRESGAWAVGRIGPVAQAAAKQLARRLSDRRVQVRREAAVALVKLGAAAVVPLRDALASENPRTRRLAAWSLGTLGPVAKAAPPQLRTLLLDDTQDHRVRRMAFRARERITGG